MGTVTLTIPVPLSAEDREELNKLLDMLQGGANSADEVAEPKKRGRKAKPVKEDEDADEEEQADEDDDSDEDVDEEEPADEDDSDEDVDEDEVLSPEQLVKLKKALRAYSAKHSKDKAVKVLKKYANASQDVKASDFGALMKKLKV